MATSKPKSKPEEVEEEITPYEEAVEKRESAKGGYEVIQEFREITDFNKVNKVGDKYSGTDERLKELQEAGLIKKA